MEILLGLLYEKFHKHYDDVFDLNNNGLSYWENTKHDLLQKSIIHAVLKKLIRHSQRIKQTIEKLSWNQTETQKETICNKTFAPLWKWSHHWEKIGWRSIRCRRMLLTVGTHRDLNDLHITWHFCKACHWLRLDRLRHRRRYCFSNVTLHSEGPWRLKSFFIAPTENSMSAWELLRSLPSSDTRTCISWIHNSKTTLSEVTSL